MIKNRRKKFQELPIPPKSRNPESFEIFRAWITPGSLECIVRYDAYNNPETIGHVPLPPESMCWGMFLADVARHIADGIEEDRGVSKDETLAGILKSFETEIALGSTGNPTGYIAGEELYED